MQKIKQQSGQAAMGVLGLLLAVVALFAIIGAGAWLFSFKGVDSGEVAVVREGGPFDGRAIKEVRQPGSGAKPIGAFNKQDTLPVTQRDLTDEAGTIIVPTGDAINVVVEGQALFQLRSDDALVKKFYTSFGRRKWGGESLSSDAGWNNFLKIRLVPILYQSVRQTVGTYDCVQLNNVCSYVQSEDFDAAQEKAKDVNSEQNLADAEQKISEAFQANLKAGLGGDYFEGVRFQNLRVTFEEAVAQQVANAQAKRAEVSATKLEAQRAAEQAKGQTSVAKEQAEQIRLKAQSYAKAPAQARIDALKALCGDAGCQNLQVLGGGDVISNLGGLGGE